MKGKLTFLYDNGKTYTANGVVAMERVNHVLRYHTYNKRTRIRTTFRVPLADVAAYCFKTGEVTKAVKLKPCAVVNTTLEKL